MYSVQTQIHLLEIRRDILIARGPHNARIVAKIDRQIRSLWAKQE